MKLPMQTIFCLLFLLNIPNGLQATLPPHFPLSKKEWNQCKVFIKKKAPSSFHKGQNYILKQKHLPCPIEKDPVTGAIYIHLKYKKAGFLGQGSNKIVTKSILYGNHPQIVARCEVLNSDRREEFALNNLKNVAGVAQLVSSIQRPEKKIDVFLRYYNSGTVKNIESSQLKVTDSQLLTLFSDLIQALIGIHNRGFMHRDLKARNILLHRSKGVLHALITDFGLTVPIDTPKLETLSVPRTAIPPETLILPVRQIDRRKAEGYSLATVLYIMLFKEKIKWGHTFENEKLSTYSEQKKQEEYLQISTEYSQISKSALSRSSGTRKKMIQLVFQLLQPDPQKRISLEEASIQLQRINYN